MRAQRRQCAAFGRKAQERLVVRLGPVHRPGVQRGRAQIRMLWTGGRLGRRPETAAHARAREVDLGRVRRGADGTRQGVRPRAHGERPLERAAGRDLRDAERAPPREPFGRQVHHAPDVRERCRATVDELHGEVARLRIGRDRERHAGKRRRPPVGPHARHAAHVVGDPGAGHGAARVPQHLADPARKYLTERDVARRKFGRRHARRDVAPPRHLRSDATLQHAAADFVEGQRLQRRAVERDRAVGVAGGFARAHLRRHAEDLAQRGRILADVLHVGRRRARHLDWLLADAADAEVLGVKAPRRQLRVAAHLHGEARLRADDVPHVDVLDARGPGGASLLRQLLVRVAVVVHLRLEHGLRRAHAPDVLHPDVLDERAALAVRLHVQETPAF